MQPLPVQQQINSARDEYRQPRLRPVVLQKKGKGPPPLLILASSSSIADATITSNSTNVNLTPLYYLNRERFLNNNIRWSSTLKASIFNS